MQNALVFCVILALACSTTAQVYLTTCARMDVPILEKAAQALCIASCSAQNCATGHCEFRKGRKVCVCSRCANGGNFPLEALIGLGKH
ncbi:hypothetical protein OESDEN_24847 [Oesophagostomum dentatum]|uniref:Uncharacterized protein n=1 Tax=Oesophagostomum dentatum TaxID=61180 RepID=A0A0B1RWJ1_OESDE|nr:hypothetical protein OESDEN_24847 [Oesophagostomum dentatum]